MGTYALLYAGGKMAETPEEQAAQMQVWVEWFGTLGESVKDIGHPFAASATVTLAGIADGGRLGATGYSLVTADSLDDAVGMAKGCPIVSEGGTVDVYETVAM